MADNQPQHKKQLKREYGPFDHGNMVTTNNARAYMFLEATKPLIREILNTTRLSNPYDCSNLYNISRNPLAIKEKKSLGADDTIETALKIIVPALIEEITHYNGISTDAGQRLEERIRFLNRAYECVTSHLGKPYGKSN